MNKFSCVLICIFLSYNFTYSQQHNAIISAHKNLSKASTDVERITALLEIGSVQFEFQTRQSVDSANFYVQKAFKLSQNISYQKGIGDSYISLSKILNFKGDLINSEKYAQQAVDLFEKSENKNDLANAYITLMSSKGETRELPESLAIAEKALQLYKQTGNKKEQANTLKEIAYLHMEIGQMPKAKDELQNSLILYKEIGFEEVQIVYSLIGVIEDVMGDYKEAIENHLKAVRIVEKFNDKSTGAAEIYNYAAITYHNAKDIPKSYEYFQKAYNIAKNYSKEDLKIMILNNLVQLAVDLKRPKEAIAYLAVMEKKYNSFDPLSQIMYLQRAIHVYVDLKDFKNAEKNVNRALVKIKAMKKDDNNLIMLYPQIVNFYFATGDYNSSRSYVEKFKILAEKNKDQYMLMQIHKRLFQLDSVQGKFDSALKEYRLERSYNDSLFSSDKNKQIAELQIKYETEKKDKDLALKNNQNIVLKKEGIIQKSELHKAAVIKDVSLGSLVLFFIIIILLYSRYRIKQKTNILLNVQKNEIDNKNVILQKLVTEKEWLLKEVHHRVKNNLQMVMSLLSAQSFFLKDKVAMEAIRESHHRIHAMSLIHKKLYQTDNVIAINMNIYIEEMISYFKDTFNTGHDIQFRLEVDPIELDTAQAVPLGLILNEAVTNSIKHAFPEGTGNILIRFKRDHGNYLKLIIKDNGIGTNEDLLETEYNSLGIKLIKGLSDDLDADLQIRNEEGLCISLEFLYNGELFEFYTEENQNHI